MTVLRFLILALLFQAPPAAPPAGSASLEGVVVKLGSNEPISGVDLELTWQFGQGTPPAAPYTAVSGADGKFAIRNVAAGNYKLVAARIGGSYTPFEFGQRGLIGRGVTFPIGAGEQRKNMRMEMASVGSISGRILDDNNRPLGHVAVMVMKMIYRRGEGIATMLQLVHSDDHGEFRLFSLVPGRYYVAARLEDLTRRTVPLGYYPPGRMLAMDRVESPAVSRRTLPTGEVVEETYQVLYYGGDSNPDSAAPIDIGPGANITGVDILIGKSKVPSRHIRGKISVGAGGSAISSIARVGAVPYRYASDKLVPTSGTDKDGAFDLAGAVPGKYYLIATVPPDPNIRTLPRPPSQFGYVVVEVGEKDLDGVTITTTEGYPFTGKISIENRPDNDPALAKLRVDFAPEPNIIGAPDMNVNAAFSPGGEFSVRTLPQWDIAPSVSGLPDTGYMKSIRMGGKDVLVNLIHPDGGVDGKMEVIVGLDASSLTGRVLDDRQEPSINVKVALVPDAPLRRRWDLYKNTATDATGSFTLRNVAPGDYKIFAWEDVEDNLWTVPEYLRTDEGRGRAIHIGPSATERAEVVVIPARRR